MDMLPPDILAALAQLGPLAAVAVYFFKRLFSYEASQKECSDNQKKIETRIAVLESKTEATSAVLSEIKSELQTIQSDVKLLLSRKGE